MRLRPRTLTSMAASLPPALVLASCSSLTSNGTTPVCQDGRRQHCHPPAKVRQNAPSTTAKKHYGCRYDKINGYRCEGWMAGQALAGPPGPRLPAAHSRPPPAGAAPRAGSPPAAPSPCREPPAAPPRRPPPHLPRVRQPGVAASSEGGVSGARALWVGGKCEGMRRSQGCLDPGWLGGRPHLRLRKVRRTAASGPRHPRCHCSAAAWRSELRPAAALRGMWPAAEGTKLATAPVVGGPLAALGGEGGSWVALAVQQRPPAVCAAPVRWRRSAWTP